LRAFLKQTRISSKKVALVAALVRGKNVSEALTILKFIPKRSAPVLAKLIASAVANAENNLKQNPENLVISKLLVDEGQTLKRGRPISRGRWHQIKKRTSHITVELATGKKS
jgi:large subunit ribosomal protein L22